MRWFSKKTDKHRCSNPDNCPDCAIAAIAEVTRIDVQKLRRMAARVLWTIFDAQRGVAAFDKLRRENPVLVRHLDAQFRSFVAHYVQSLDAAEQYEWEKEADRLRRQQMD